jgi:tRNA dimethylallyltransferase
MNESARERQLSLLLGCTAVGKTALSLPLAERLGAEIISVDSMQIYRRMDIGTAKPSEAERQRVRHHLIDVAEPAEPFSAARFVEQADAAIADIHGRGQAALAVAGTPFYLMALLYGLFEGPSADAEVRARIRQRAEREGAAALHSELARIDPEAARRIHPNDMRRIERALEVWELTGRPISALQRQWTRPPRYPFRAVGLRRSREDLSRRINARVRGMIEAGLVDEVRRLISEPGCPQPGDLSEQARQALGYAEMIAHLRGETSLNDAVEAIKINTRRFAKSQRTWFRRIPGVHWLDVPAETEAETMLEPALTALRGA